MIDVNAHIRNKLRVKGLETLPFTGWLDSNRTHIAEIFAEVGYKVGAEVGVRAGDNALTICQKNPSVKLFCIDPWAPFEGGRPSQHRQNMYFYHTRKKLKGYDVVFLKKTSMEALNDITDQSLDFVYIDAKHDFDYVMMDIICWSQKVKSGGMVAGHDYIHLHNCGVIAAVNGYVAGHTITQWYVTKDHDPSPSFFWVKP
jgi:hypothetical protein